MGDTDGINPARKSELDRIRKGANLREKENAQIEKSSKLRENANKPIAGGSILKMPGGAKLPGGLVPYTGATGGDKNLSHAKRYWQSIIDSAVPGDEDKVADAKKMIQTLTRSEQTSDPEGFKKKQNLEAQKALRKYQNDLDTAGPWDDAKKKRAQEQMGVIASKYPQEYTKFQDLKMRQDPRNEAYRFRSGDEAHNKQVVINVQTRELSKNQFPEIYNMTDKYADALVKGLIKRGVGVPE